MYTKVWFPRIRYAYTKFKPKFLFPRIRYAYNQCMPKFDFLEYGMLIPNVYQGLIS